MNTTGLSLVMYFYMFICLSILVYSVAYMQMDRMGKRQGARNKEKWRQEIAEECRRVAEELGVSARHRNRLEKRLKKLSALLSYHEAILQLMQEQGERRVQPYLDACLLSFQSLAVYFVSRPAQERAFFAHLMALYHPNRQNGGGQIAEILLLYFDDSTVYCRENTLQALYASGKAGTVAQAFSLLNDSGWYHYPRLLSDGLAAFPGDQTELARRLWARCGGWNDSLQVAVVQFITNLPGEAFAQEFLQALADRRMPLETRFALVRYFQRHVTPKAKPVLLGFLSDGQADQGGLAIVAASALARYPGEDSRAALLEAVRSRNWYVRQNAAASLVELGGSWRELRLLKKQGDRYAVEMMTYMLESRAKESRSASRKKKKSA